MFILSSQLLVTSYDLKMDEKVEEKMIDPSDAIFAPSMEPHIMKNVSETQTVTFSCCIVNVYEDESI
jgi:ferredoxin-fold anticodon binding domain-containing protein